MAQRTDSFDLGGLRLSAGEGRRIEVHVGLDPFVFSGESYAVEPEEIPIVLDVSRMTGKGYALRLRFAARLLGPCMRCLAPARPETEVDAREVDQPGGGDELDSPYLEGDVLDVRQWARDALALALPAQVVCREDCAGLCPRCGIDLNHAPADHHHDPEPDPRWDKLRELRLE